MLQAIIICNVKENVWSSKLKKNDKKPHFGLDLDPLGPKSGHQFFFFPKKIWLCQSLDIMAHYHHVKYIKKNNNPILRKFSDEQTNGYTDDKI